ncbi:MAG: DUF429 domain-containing protein [Chloroflexi bacterium]|nr:DUF429 domain-containing protein [Chloroflexota bacterium]
MVPNEEGARPVDRQITHLFGRYGAGCYPAYRNRPGTCTRGEAIVEALAEDGFVQNPHVSRCAAMRSVFEVYPHPAMLALFRLERTLQYKARPKRSLYVRQRELARLLAHLQTLSSGEPGMDMPVSVIRQDVSALQGTRFKYYEDLLDAAVCAYIAYYAWYWGPAGYRVYGDLRYGYILVPMTEWLRRRLTQQRAPGHSGEAAGV